LKIKIAQFGLGPIGLETLRLAATKPWAQVVGAIDIDPALTGRYLKGLLPSGPWGQARVHPTFEELDRTAKPDLVFHTAVSRFSDAYRQIEPMVRGGVSVVSSCEELLYPRLREPDLSARLDKLCRKTGARVLGTGVNPGFVMDLLPVCLTAVSREVRAVSIQRVVDASSRRGPLQRKIGSGLAPSRFRQLFREGRAGHAGLKESLALVAHSLGWSVRDLTETGRPIVATRGIRTQHVKVRKGETCGLHQRATAKVDGKVRLTLDLKMYLGAEDPRDEIRIEGEPPLHVVIHGGVAGDQATVAALVNSAPRLLTAPPGLRLVTELPLSLATT
jgi:4-hydroxy-tetrahydrodipicolinate reductase